MRHVVRSTGESVGMSALTTMAGFGGLLLSFHPGLRSIGILANLGIGLTLIFAMIALPAFIQFLEDRKALPALHAIASDPKTSTVDLTTC